MVQLVFLYGALLRCALLMIRRSFDTTHQSLIGSWKVDLKLPYWSITARNSCAARSTLPIAYVVLAVGVVADWLVSC